MKRSFVLDAFLENRLGNLTPNTKDSEVLFIQSACRILSSGASNEYTKMITEQRKTILDAVYDAFDYILANLVDDEVCLIGEMFGENLNNACLLYRAYCDDVKNVSKLVDDLKKSIQENYWNGEYFIDYPKWYAVGGEADDLEGKIGCSITCHRRPHPRNPLDGTSFDILGNALAVLYGVATDEQAVKILKSSGVAGYRHRMKRRT